MSRSEIDHSTARSSLAFAPQVYRGTDDPAARSNDFDALRIELRAEVRSLRALVARADPTRELALELAQIRASIDELGPAPKRDRVSNWLRSRGIEGGGATRIAALMKDAPGDAIEEGIRNALEQLVRVEPWSFGGARHVVSLVGPSGVGKTTTAAKLAARERMAGRSVALVTCDGFRVGAVDQLERYADLLGATCHVAETGAELAAVLDTATEDVVFVDTSGRPPTADGPEAILAARAKKRPSDATTILCIGAATRAPDAARIVATYAPAAPTVVCVTKLDETGAPSALVHAPVAAKLPLALVCRGPRVPEDIDPATFDGILAQLMGDREVSK